MKRIALLLLLCVAGCTADPNYFERATVTDRHKGRGFATLPACFVSLRLDNGQALTRRIPCTEYHLATAGRRVVVRMSLASGPYVAEWEQP